MPETAMHEYDLPTPPEYEVGRTWQIPGVQPVAITHREDKHAHGKFGAHVLGTHPRHDLRTFFRGERIDHNALFSPHRREHLHTLPSLSVFRPVAGTKTPDPHHRTPPSCKT